MPDTEKSNFPGPNGTRIRYRSTFLVRWDAVITVIVCSVASFSIGMAIMWKIMSPLLELR